MTFKELRKVVARGNNSQQQQQTTLSSSRVWNKPFWIWNIEEHKVADIITSGDCCFNHIIGLPKKNAQEKPFFDYEKMLFDNFQNYKHIWIKKSTGLGITEFMLRYMAWLCLRNDNLQGTQMCIVTGPRIDLAITLIDRMKRLFIDKGQITFDTKETVIEINGVHIEAYPSHHLDAMRGLPNVSFILLDEADFFPPNQQQDARDVSERYIGKSNPWIIMVSTPNAPDGLFERIEKEPEETCLYKRLFLDYTYGLGRIYTEAEIAAAKASPSFEREYNLKYLGLIGNVFHVKDIEAAMTEYEIVEYLDDIANPPYLQGVMGLDPSWGVSSFGIVVTHFVDGLVRIVHANQYTRSDHSEMLSVVWDLIQRYNVTKVLVDGSAPSFIRALKLQWGERSDYENIEKNLREYMRVEPVSFGVEHKALLYHAKFMLENRYVQIHPTKFDKLITSLRSAWAKDGVLDKEVTSFDDILPVQS
jgi:hypothetical protein